MSRGYGGGGYGGGGGGPRGPPDIEGLHSLKVDNISFRTTQEDLRRLFDRYGEIGDIHIPRDRYTKSSKGFGFVRFYSRRDAEYALEKLDGRWEDGRELRVAFAHYKRPFDGGPPPRGGGGGGGGRYRRNSRSRSRSRSPRRRRGRSNSRSRSRSGSPARRDRGGGGGAENGRQSRSRSGSFDRRRNEGSKSASRSP